MSTFLFLSNMFIYDAENEQLWKHLDIVLQLIADVTFLLFFATSI